MSDDGALRTLYIGNLEPTTSEDLLYALFSTFGSCVDCKVIREVGHDPYAFVKYSEMKDAQAALMAMNKRSVLGRELKVNWASSPGNNAKQDTTNHFHVYIGDVSPEIDSAQLRSAFAPFGEISECKVIRDPHTQLSKGYGFVCFVRREEAEIAIASMNGQWLGGRPIRTNWASGKGNIAPAKPSKPTLNYDDVFKQASATNTTVYCGGIQSGLSEELLRQMFSEFGDVLDVRVFKEKCFAFVRMETKESAAHAIVGLHGADVNGASVRCSWGKEVSDTGPAQSPQKTTGASPSVTQPPNRPENGYGAGNQGQGYYMPMGYWGYQQGYPQVQPQMPGGAYMPASYNQMNYMQQNYSQPGYGGGFPPNYGGGAMSWPGSNSGHSQQQ